MEKYNAKMYYIVVVNTMAVGEKYPTINEAIYGEWKNPEIVLGYISTTTPADLLLMLVNSVNDSTPQGTLYILHGECADGTPRILNNTEIKDW